jgi:uncharacterized protein YukE
MTMTRPDAMGMRHAAAQLRVKADRAAALHARLNRHVSGMTFAGPAADQFHVAMGVEQYRLREVSRILDQAAQGLDTAAAQVEADPTQFYGQ